MRSLRRIHHKALVFSDSDHSLKQKDILFLKKLGAQKIFAANTSSGFSGFVETIPLGVADNSMHSPLYPYLNADIFLQADASSNFPTKFDGSIYLNVTTANAPKVRMPLVDELRDHPRAKILKPAFTLSGRMDFLRNIRENCLIPCPSGNGRDTHRLWETLYMGGTPVMIEDTFNKRLLDGLPVLFVKTWHDLWDQDLMEQLWYETTTRTYSFEKLYFSFWSDKVYRARHKKFEKFRLN